MPYSSPTPDPRPSRKSSGIIDAIVQAEKMIQVAFVLPCAVLIGWAIGWLLDRALHQTWIYLAGILFGGASGLVYVIRLALAAANRNDGGENPKSGGSAGTAP